MTAHEFLPLLDGVKKSGDGWIARCPGHDDKKPSLSINQNDKGDILLKCHAGCTTQAVCDALGIAVSELFADPDSSRSNGRTNPKPPPAPDFAALTAQYETALSDDLAQEHADRLGVSVDALRRLHAGWDGKALRFPMRDATGSIIGIRRRFANGDKCAVKGSSNGLFIPDGIIPSKPVFICEGPSDTAAALTLGLNAVGRSSCTSDVKQLVDFCGHYGVNEIGIVADADEPGRKGAEALGDELAAACESVRIIEPPTPHKDLRAWLQTGATFDDVMQAVVSAREWQAPEDNSSNSFISSETSGDTTSEPDERWPEPLDDAALYGVAGELVRIVEPHTEADSVAVLVSFLVGFGNAIGRTVYFMADGAMHYCNLFAVLVGQTAKGRKGTSWNQPRRVLKDAAGTWTEERVLSGMSSGEGLIWAIRDPIIKCKSKNKGKNSTLVAEVEDAGVDDKRLMVLESEFATVLRVLERDGNTLSPIIRQAWESGKLQTLTKNSPAKASDAHVSIVGHVTKDELRRYLNDVEQCNGFANRFLWFCVKRSKTLPDGGSLSDQALTKVVEQVKAALEFASTPSRIQRDSKARELWHAIYPKLSEGMPGLFGTLTARAEAQVMRLAMVYAVLDCSTLIRVEHLTAALALWEHCEASVRYLFGAASGDQIADSILTALRSTPIGLTRTEIQRMFGNNLRADRMERALKTLVDNGKAIRTFEKTEGRPAERWIAARGLTKETKNTK